MEIKASKLRSGVEVDMPIEWKHKPSPRQRSIRYKDGLYELFDIKTGDVDYRYNKLSVLVIATNSIFNYNDSAVDD